MGKLTVLSVKAATKPGRYQDGEGLILLVKPTGARSWLLRVQVDGKRRDFGLGSAADVSLAKARTDADTLRALAKSGVDPVAAKKAEKAAKLGIPTFRVAANTVHGEHKAGWKNAKHEAQWLSSLAAYAFPIIGDVRVDQVDSAAIRDLLMPIWIEKPETARRVRQRVVAVLDWAHSKGYRPTEAPMRSINKGLPRQPKNDGHFAALPYFEVPAVLAKLAENESVGRLALRLVILTATRSGEVRGATWAEIDLEAALWTIPADRMKAGKEHVVPLSQSALEVLKQAEKLRVATDDSEVVFPGWKRKPMSDMTMAKALRIAGGGKATVHGFRSSFRDWAAETTGTPGDVVEAALAHSIKNKVEAAYRRTNYLEKRRLLMDAWASYLSETPANVMRLPVKTAA
jgi:integrase